MTGLDSYHRRESTSSEDSGIPGSGYTKMESEAEEARRYFIYFYLSFHVMSHVGGECQF